MHATVDKTQLIPFNKLARQLPGKFNDSLHPDCLHRWTRKGLLPHGGRERVKLEATRVGGTWCTTWERLERFFAAVQGDVQPPLPTKAEVDESMRRRDAAATRRLERLGVRRG